jgi:hypothetical protein
MLVSKIGEEVGTVDIVPDEGLWEIGDWLKWGSDVSELWLIRSGSAWSLWVNILESSLNSCGAKVSDKGNCCEFH